MAVRGTVIQDQPKKRLAAIATLLISAIDVTDGRRLFFTRNGFRGRAAHERAVARLNGWLEQLRQG